MMKPPYIKPVFICLSLFLFCCAVITNTKETFIYDNERFSPVDLAAGSDDGILYIAGHEAKQVAVFDRENGTIIDRVPLPEKPSGIELSRHGTQLYIACGSSNGRILVYSAYLDSIIADIEAGHTPVSPVLSPGGRELYVCNRFDNDVSVIDLAAQKEISRIPSNAISDEVAERNKVVDDRVSIELRSTSYPTAGSASGSAEDKYSESIPEMREPVSAAITPDGKLLFVANHLPPGGDVASGVSVIDTAEKKVTAFIRLPNGSTGLRGICVSPDGRYVYVTHILARYNLPTTQLERGWMNTNAMSIIEAGSMRFFATVLLDDVDLGAANPWDVECSPCGKYICVTHAGTHELSIIDRAGLHNKLDMVASGEARSAVSSSLNDVQNDLSFLGSLRRRIRLKGNGPRALSVSGETVYIAEYFSDTLGIVGIENDAENTPLSTPLDSNEPLSAERRGEMLFNDASLCFQQWQTCASCHPDGRADGLGWDLLNDGVGNPKNTKSLLLSHSTPPVMATGVREESITAVRAGIRHIQFAGRPEEDVLALEAYISSLAPVQSPFLAEGKLSLSARRGKKIFRKAGCAVCHPPPLFTDLKAYDVGTGIDMERGKEFDTPSLIEVWRTAPFLYDGRAASMKDVLAKHNMGDFHGVTSKLSKVDMENLAEFVLSL